MQQPFSSELFSENGHPWFVCVWTCAHSSKHWLKNHIQFASFQMNLKIRKSVENIHCLILSICIIFTGTFAKCITQFCTRILIFIIRRIFGYFEKWKVLHVTRDSICCLINVVCCCANLPYKAISVDFGWRFASPDLFHGSYIQHIQEGPKERFAFNWFYANNLIQLITLYESAM